MQLKASGELTAALVSSQQELVAQKEDLASAIQFAHAALLAYIIASDLPTQCRICNTVFPDRAAFDLHPCADRLNKVVVTFIESIIKLSHGNTGLTLKDLVTSKDGIENRPDTLSATVRASVYLSLWLSLCLVGFNSDQLDSKKRPRKTSQSVSAF
jgi:hypothetical protein